MMSFYPGDPNQRFPHSANSEMLVVLQEHSSPPPDDPKIVLFEIDDYELRTHPELYDRLLVCSERLPEQCNSAAFGYAILVTPAGIIFGVGAR